MLGHETLWRDIEHIRARSPLVHNITNFVVMNTTANALLALGASPVMAHAVDEVEEMAGLASALVLNIGTLSPSWIEAMHRAGRVAVARGVPVVLDPVGSGATRYRTETSLALIRALAPTIIRGNAGEIASLAGEVGETRGVDSTRDVGSIETLAVDLAAHWHCTIAVSGAIDFVTDGVRSARIHNGHPMMARVTGTGCTATALTGAFAAVSATPFEAATNALATMGIAGEIAAEHADGPGSLQLRLLDALYRLDGPTIEHRVRVEIA